MLLTPGRSRMAGRSQRRVRQDRTPSTLAQMKLELIREDVLIDRYSVNRPVNSYRVLKVRCFCREFPCHVDTAD